MEVIESGKALDEKISITELFLKIEVFKTWQPSNESQLGKTYQRSETQLKINCWKWKNEFTGVETIFQIQRIMLRAKGFQ
jgi:hypothetical protein